MAAARSIRRAPLLADSDDDDDFMIVEPPPPRAAAPAAAAPVSSQPSLMNVLQRAPPSRSRAGDPLPPSSSRRRAAPRAALLWADKHAPSSVADLAVAKKKLDAVADWLRFQTTYGGGVRGGRALVLSGPSGAGKSTAARLLAAAAGFVVVEWAPPVPTLWAEHRHAAAQGAEFTSKMDAFEAWLARARTLAPLPLAPPPPRPVDGAMAPPPPPSAAPRPSAKLLLLEDVPLAYGSAPGARDRLCAALASIAAASRFPAIICLTETSAGMLGDERSLGSRDALACLEEAGAAHIAFNPATKAELARAVLRVAAAEAAPLTQAAAASLADAARGDIRAAVAALQMRLAGAPGGGAGGGGGGRKRGRGADKGDKGKAAAPGAAAPWGARDDTLSLFHALGKLLYNKRLPPPPLLEAHPSAFPLADAFRRAPPEVADPEAVLAQAALTPAAALAFLHENVLDFIADDAVEDAADALAALSHAAALLRGGARGGGGREADADETDPWGLGPRAAASVAARGVMFANAHPAPRRFLPLRGPAAAAVERAAAEARAEVAAGVAAARGGDACCGGGGSAAAAEVLPFLRSLAAALPPAAARALPPRRAAGALPPPRRGAEQPQPLEVDRAAAAAAADGAADEAEDPVDDSDGDA